jgi:hypothetical protein
MSPSLVFLSPVADMERPCRTSQNTRQSQNTQWRNQPTKTRGAKGLNGGPGPTSPPPHSYATEKTPRKPLGLLKLSRGL